MNVQIHFTTINGGIDIQGGSGPFGGPFDVTWNTIEDNHDQRQRHHQRVRRLLDGLHPQPRQRRGEPERQRARRRGRERDLNDNLSQSAARLMFEGLYMLDEHMKLQPQLAESYEATEDAKEFVFHLRKGVTFHDGTPFNAAAVKASFDRAGNPENHLKRQSLFVMIDHTDAVDDTTVKVVLKYPFGAFVNDIAHPGALIVSPKSVQEFGKEVTRHPVRHRTVPVRQLERRHAEDEEERALLEAGPAEARHDHLSQRAGERRADRHAADRRGAVHLSGAAGDDQIAGQQPDDHGVRRALDPVPLCRAEQHAQAVQRSARAPGAELCRRQAGIPQGGVQRPRRSDGFDDAAAARVLREAGRRGPTIRRRRRRCWQRPAIRTASRPR